MTHLSIVNTAIFAVVAFFHALRIAYQSPVVVGSVEVPLWLSAMAVVGAVVLAVFNWKSQPRGRDAWLRLVLTLLVIDIAGLLYSWLAKLSYWSLSGDTFLWFVIIDLLLVGIVLQALRKRA